VCLTIRCDAIEEIFFTITERILATLDEAAIRKVMDDLMDDLNANVVIGEAGLVADGDWNNAERMVLRQRSMDVMLDQIERSADVLRKSRDYRARRR
jgi:hypothetical protein